MFNESEPQIGHYKRRAVKGGVWIAVKIFVENSELKCTSDGMPACPFEQWTWVCQRPISKAEYEIIMRHKGDHNALMADTRTAIDLSENFIRRTS